MGTIKALLGPSGGECYAYGRYVGRVKAGQRRWRVGPATYWVAYTNDGRWLGSRHDRNDATALVFAWWERVQSGQRPPLPL